METTTESAFKEVNDIGVIWVMDEAIKQGYYNGNPEWVNLGQGEPEVGAMAGAPERISQFSIEPGDDRYGPLNGMHELRASVAAHYNRLYRIDKASQYTADNVSIAMGGRLALSRIFSILGEVRLGYKVPEYPAYKDLINYHLDRITPVCLPSKKENNYNLSASELGHLIQAHELGAFLLSNPCNPTGHVVHGDELKEYVALSGKLNCPLIIDEMYSHYIYQGGKPAESPVSAAAFIDDVNQDQVLLVDGLTKSFRYPGWRLAWVVGPQKIIANLGRAASGIDGGPSQPIQRAALKVLEPQQADQETTALREVFSRKQTIAQSILRDAGVICSADANSTFYIWADISGLPAPLNHAIPFFKEALKHKVMVVPGHLFDINPGRKTKNAGFNHYVRISFGPKEENLVMGLERIAALIKTHQVV